MSVLNKNEFFYTALQIAVAQDKNPDWIFKTNLLHIDNIAQEIYTDNLIRPTINLNSIYYYLQEETPFHVHFENFAIQYTKNDEVAQAQVSDEHVFNIELGFHNVSEYPTTIGYDKLPYDFEYPGLGTNGSDYTEYDKNFGFEDVEKDIRLQVSGWYPFATPPQGKYIDRTTCQRGTLVEDPICGSYDYQPTVTEFNNVLKSYNVHNNSNVSKRDLITEYYKDPYYFENTTNYVYIMNQNKTFDWVRDKANNGYKGLQIHGGKNDGDRVGYETTDYDYELYDYITYENKYYLSDSNVEDWFREEETKYNINKVVPVNTEKFYVPETPFATKKINVYLNEKSKINNFNLFGGCAIENYWLKNYNNNSSYASLKRTFNVGKNPWEIDVTVNIKEDLPVVYGKSTRFVNRLIQILGSYTDRFTVPQLYFIKDTFYLDISTNGKDYTIRLEKNNINSDKTYNIKIGYDKTKYYMIIDDEEISINSTTPIYSEPIAPTLHLGDSTYQQDLINYVPRHYQGGAFEYRNGVPFYSEEENIIYVPSMTVIFPISKNDLVIDSVNNVSDLPQEAEDGTVYIVESENKQYICYDNIWTEYDPVNEYVQQLGILDTQGNQHIISLYSARQAEQSFQFILENVSTNSNISIPESLDNEHYGLLVYRQGQISIEVADYYGKNAGFPTDITNYPVYFFNTLTDSFYYKSSSDSTWEEQTKFTLLGKVTKSIYGNIYLSLYPSFSEAKDIEYLYQDSDINVNLFKLLVNGNNVTSDVSIDTFLHLNRDYEINLEKETRKEYIRLLDKNGETRNLSEGSIVRIDCLDYDYLYDIMFVNRETTNQEFTRYKCFLGYFASVQELVAKTGSIKLKYHDYFYNTTTNTEWVLESANQLEITQVLELEDIEIELTLENYDNEIYEVLNFEFSWLDTGMPFGTTKEQDLALLRGTKLLRPNNTAKGSEELRTGVRDGVIIDIFEDASLIDVENIKLSPRVVTEFIPEGKNRELALDLLNNESVIKFVHGKYQDSILKWKSKTGLKPLPDTKLNVLTDVTSDDTEFIEIERDTIDIKYSKLLYGQTEREFSVEFDDYQEDNTIILTFDGKILELNTDYTYTQDSTNPNLFEFSIINESLYSPKKKYCYGIYLAKSNDYTVVYKDNITLPFTIPYPTPAVNVSVLNNFMLFDNEGQKLNAPYMKWYYLTEDTNEVILPISPDYTVESYDVNVYIGAGHDLTKLLQVQASQYTIEGNKLKFVSYIPKDLTIGVIISTQDSYNISFSYGNGRFIVDYDLNYIVDYFENYITDYGTNDGNISEDSVITISSKKDLHAKTIVYIGNSTKFNFRLDTYQRTEDNIYEIYSDKFDKKSVCVWKNGILLHDSEYVIDNNIVKVNTSYNLDTDIIQVWYKVNKSVISYEHNKIIISDTNEIYNLKALPIINTFLVYPFKYDDVKMYVDNANYLTQPNINPQNLSQSKPGRIQIGNEIIEFWSINYNDTIPNTETKCHSLSGFVKSIKGSSNHQAYYKVKYNEETKTTTYEYKEDLVYPVGTGVQDIGNRFETLISNTKNKNSRIDYMTVDQNWLDYPERTYINEYDETCYVHSLMPWYNVPGTVDKDDDVSVWKNEAIKVVKDYNPETDSILTIENDKNLDKITNYIYRSPVGKYTYDCNSLVLYDSMYYRSGFVSDSINIELFNEEESYQYLAINITGTMEDAAIAINNVVNTDILFCKAINDELEEQSYMQFILKNGYSMRLSENDTEASFFIQELFGGIQKSANGNVEQAEIAISSDNGLAIITPDGRRFQYIFKEPSGGETTMTLLCNDVNADFSKHHVWFKVKMNPQINNINQLNIVNYNKEPVKLEELGYMTNNFKAIGITNYVEGCSAPLTEENANGEIIINNMNKGRIIINEKSYNFDSMNYSDEGVNLIGIHIPFEIKADDTFFGTKLIKQELGKDFFIEYNAVKFYKRLPLDTLIRIQNKNIIVNSNVDYLHSHLDS